MKERSLVLFTLLMQAAVGMFGGFFVLRLQHTGDMLSNLMVDRSFWTVWLLALPAMAASLFHLGSPRRAVGALRNLRSSWLSREILFVSLFVAFSGAYSLVAYRWASIASPYDWLGWLALGTGLAAVFCMAKVYDLPGITRWGLIDNLTFFFKSVLMLGVTSTAWILALASFALSDVRQTILMTSALIMMSLPLVAAMALEPFAWLNADGRRTKFFAGAIHWKLVAWLACLGVALWISLLLAMPYPLLTTGLLTVAYASAWRLEISDRVRFYALRRPQM